MSENLESIRTAFVPSRLRMARELKGISQGELARKTVSPAAVSQYERGVATPSVEVLQDLADRLAVSPEFFTVADDETDVPAYFRSLRSAPAGARKQARHSVQLVRQLAEVLEKRVRFPPLDVPRLPVLEAADREQPLAAARAVRKRWSVPPGPIDNVVRLVERHGVLVAVLGSGHERIDAFSVPFSDRPAIVMSAAKGKRDRSRLDVSHELGHLVMHSPADRATKEVEYQAQAFAAELLMPADEIVHELPRGLDLDRLITLKRRWQVSIAALLYRAKSLNVMPEATYTQAMKMMSARGWRRHEPADLGAPESPVLLRAAIEAAGLSEQQLADELAIPLPLLRDVLSAAADHRPEIVI